MGAKTRARGELPDEEVICMLTRCIVASSASLSPFVDLAQLSAVLLINVVFTDHSISFQSRLLSSVGVLL